jgi:hypothetical protein
VLRYRADLPLATVEAKPDGAAVGEGMQQSKDYAGILSVKFAYFTNGNEILIPDVLELPPINQHANVDEEGSRIKWHSPRSPHSWQVFCVSAFGALRHLPDCDALLARLFDGVLPASQSYGGWRLTPEHEDADLLVP